MKLVFTNLIKKINKNQLETHWAEVTIIIIYYYCSLLFGENEPMIS